MYVLLGIKQASYTVSLVFSLCWYPCAVNEHAGLRPKLLIMCANLAPYRYATEYNSRNGTSSACSYCSLDALHALRRSAFCMRKRLPLFFTEILLGLQQALSDLVAQAELLVVRVAQDVVLTTRMSRSEAGADP